MRSLLFGIWIVVIFLIFRFVGIFRILRQQYRSNYYQHPDVFVDNYSESISTKVYQILPDPPQQYPQQK